MGELGALFNPGMRHELEERRAKAARREEEGNARDGDLRIDLESGVAVINIPGADQEESEDQAPAAVESGTATNDVAEADAAQTADGSGAAGSEESAQPADRPAPAVRPRGKRGMSSASR